MQTSETKRVIDHLFRVEQVVRQRERISRAEFLRRIKIAPSSFHGIVRGETNISRQVYERAVKAVPELQLTPPPILVEWPMRTAAPPSAEALKAASVASSDALAGVLSGTSSPARAPTASTYEEEVLEVIVLIKDQPFLAKVKKVINFVKNRGKDLQYLESLVQ